jgi:DNA-3-methyladenine glycosylase II
MTPEAHAHLADRDPVMARLIREIGRCEIKPRPHRSPFESLVRAVAHQQLNGTAAETILGRFLALFPKKRFPSPKDLESVTDEAIRAAGFSYAKIAAIRDIAEKAKAGRIPGSRKIVALSDEEIVERLTECRGIGRWSVEMLLIFKLGRPDILPVDDFGVRNGFRHAYGRPEMPRPKELMEIGERWRPYRTTASWYLWRAADRAGK